MLFRLSTRYCSGRGKQEKGIILLSPVEIEAGRGVQMAACAETVATARMLSDRALKILGVVASRETANLMLPRPHQRLIATFKVLYQDVLHVMFAVSFPGHFWCFLPLFGCAKPLKLAGDLKGPFCKS